MKKLRRNRTPDKHPRYRGKRLHDAIADVLEESIAKGRKSDRDLLKAIDKWGEDNLCFLDLKAGFADGQLAYWRHNH